LAIFPLGKGQWLRPLWRELNLI